MEMIVNFLMPHHDVNQITKSSISSLFFSATLPHKSKIWFGSGTYDQSLFNRIAITIFAWDIIRMRCIL